MSILSGSMILASALLATGALAQDAPSTPFMDPRVEEVLKTMGQTLTGASAFAFKAEITLDELHPKRDDDSAHRSSRHGYPPAGPHGLGRRRRFGQPKRLV